jgi:lipopolysaccharide transport system ATP-binding protein
MFVSHNMAAVLNLCERGLLLHEGRIAMTGKTQEVCNAYAATWRRLNARQKTGDFLHGISLIDETGANCAAVSEGEKLCFCCRVRVPDERCLVSLIVKDARNAPLFELFDHSFSPSTQNGADVSVQVQVSFLPLLPGRYSVDFWLADRMSNRLERVDDAFEFDVTVSSRTETSLALNGSFRCKSEWKTL